MSDYSPGAAVEATQREFTGGQKIFGRYMLVRILGQGGMGVIWLARDEELKHEVALKFLPQAVVHDRALVDDLKRETRRSLELTHKNIVRIYHFEHDESMACISMEYVDGETLSNLRAEKEQRVFQLNELAPWTTQLCEALDYAHNHARVIHRDLKPANLMVNRRGELKVCDFGIARSLGDTVSRLTVEQGRSGTLVYMSPQQLEGKGGTHLDDIYSLGATLYELLTTKPPFYAGNIDRQIHERVPPSMTERRKDLNIEPASVSAIWEQTVADCLQKDPAKRPQSAMEVAHRLQLSSMPIPARGATRGAPSKAIFRAGTAAVFICLLGLGGWYFTKSRAHTKAAAIATNALTQVTAIPEKSIAVLPLENLTQEKENAYFADGIQDELLSNLAKIKDLKVISRTSVMQYKAGITRNLKEIAQQLGVSNVVEGSVRRSGNHVRVSVQLIDALNDRHIWVQNYDRTLADSLALEGELAMEIAAGVGATLSPQEKARVEATPTKNTAAYDAYLRGRALAAGLTTDFSNLESAARSFQEAVALDPGFALAWAYLSCANSWAYWSGIDTTSARVTAAKDAADRAVTVDPNLPENHLALGYYRYYGLRDFKGALAEFQVAEKSLPNDVGVLRAIGLIQRRFAHWDEAIAVFRRVFELDPRNLESAGNFATLYMAKRRFPDALAITDHILAVEPSNTQAILLKMGCLWALGKPEAADSLLANPGATLHIRAYQAVAMRRFAEAADLLSKALKDAPDNEKTDILLDLGFAQKRAGNVAASKAAYQQAVQEFTLALTKVVPDAGPTAELHSNLGVAYAGLGDAASAVAEGRKGTAMQPTSDDPFEGPLREEEMAEIYALLGNADEAIPILKRWIQVPSGTDIIPTLLRIDPIWDPIRNDPRFQGLVAE